MAGEKWTKEEIKYIKENYPCDILGRTKKSVQLKALRIGVTKKNRWDKDKNEQTLCKCGCKTTIFRWQKNSKERFYVFNHQPRKPFNFTKKYLRERWLGDKNPMWNGGITKKKLQSGHRLYPREFDSISRKLKTERVYCEICGNKTKEIHHIDGNTYNNLLKNLKALCKSCHTKAHLKF